MHGMGKKAKHIDSRRMAQTLPVGEWSYAVTATHKERLNNNSRLKQFADIKQHGTKGQCKAGPAVVKPPLYQLIFFFCQLKALPCMGSLHRKPPLKL
jgi:hypothetical protein